MTRSHVNRVKQLAAKRSYALTDWTNRPASARVRKQCYQQLKTVTYREVFAVIGVIIGSIGHRMEDPENGFRFPSGAGNFCSFSKVIRSVIVPTLSAARLVLATLSWQVNLPLCEADHSPTSGAGVKDARRYPSPIPLSFTAWCLIKLKQLWFLTFFLK
jgi:hypothetical protein